MSEPDDFTQLVKEIPPLSVVLCATCGAPSLFMGYCGEHGSPCLQKTHPPRTCGRLRCMVAVGEMEPVGA